MTVCEKHRKTPAKGYSPCPGCEVERLLENEAKFRGLLLWTLYHHQGGSSDVGQPIRRALGIGQHDRMTAEHIAEAKAAAGVPANAGNKPTERSDGRP